MKIKKTEVVSEDKRQRVDALSIAKETAKELQNLRGEFETSQLAVKDYLDKSGGILQFAIEKLSEAAKNQPNQIVNVEPLNELIKKTLESFELKLEQIQTACETIKVPDVNNEFRPDITVEQAEVDLTKLEDLLRKELPKLFEKFLAAIPETPPLDLTELDKKFQKMFELLEKNLKKQMPMFVGGGGGGNVPLVQTPNGVAVPIANPDGSEFTAGGSSLAKPTDKYKYHAESTAAGYEYAYYEDKDGNWFVQRETLATGYLAFAAGTGGFESVYVDSTSAPAGPLTFDVYSNVF